MVIVYVTLIIHSRKKFEDVPAKLQAAVKAELEAMQAADTEVATV